MNQSIRSVWMAVIVSLVASAGVAHASPAGGAITGVVGSEHASKRGEEFYFEISADVSRHLMPGDLLIPDGKSQRIVYYGGRIGFCIDRGIPAGTASTTYHFRGGHDEIALDAARTAMRHGLPRDEAVWAAMASRSRR